MFIILQNTLIGFWHILSEMAPYLLLGFFVAGVLSVLISAQTVERHLGGRGGWPVVKATVFGIPLPLCSCGVIPVAASLRRHGASRGATTAFLLSAPQTGVDSIMVTFSLLGPVFAVFRPLAAFVTGLFGGSLVSLLEGNEAAREPAPVCTNECCSPGTAGSRLARIFRYGFVSLPRDIGKALLVGLILAGLISALIPDDYLSGVLGAGIGAMALMMLLGIPVYVCATASVPVAAALIAKGVSPGAALVFLLTGPATNAAAITTIWKIMGRRTAITYLLTVATTALASGLFLDYIFRFQGATIAAVTPGVLPGYLKTVSAVVLAAVLGAGIWWPSRRSRQASPQHQETPMVTLFISGMTCQHCVESVHRALSREHGVQSVEVNLKEGTARVNGDHLDVSQLRDAVEALGYTVDRVEEED
jgi:uncharacterized membrane protein YraQ (UPF0718 family)/copper chaperone CopZ